MNLQILAAVAASGEPESDIQNFSEAYARLVKRKYEALEALMGPFPDDRPDEFFYDKDPAQLG